jgi:hypothetical protein
MNSSRCPTQTLLILALLLAAWLRFYRIEYQSYWNDEGNSRVLAGQPVGDIVRAAAADIHPPLYYLVLKGWRAAAGESEIALRGFSAFAGIVLVALLYRLGREYFNASAAVAAAFLAAVNPFLIYYAQEARMYELVTALGAASFLLFSLWLRSSRPPASPFGNWQPALGYCLVSALGLYTHYAFAFILIAENLAALGGLLAHRRGEWQKRLGAWAGLQAVTLLLFLPWLPTAYRQLTTWPAAREFQPFASALAEVTRYLAFGRTLTPQEAGLGVGAAAVLLVLGLWRGGQTITPLFWLIIPAGLTLAFGLLSETFSKFLLVVVPALCLLVGNSVGGWRPAHGSRLKAASAGVWAAGAVFFTFTTYLSLNNLYFNPAYFRDDYRGIARAIESVQRPGDAVITISPNLVEAFGYYHSAGAPVYPLPHQRPLDRAETAAALDDIAARHDRLFVVLWGEGQADPEHFVEDWLSTHAFKAGDEWYGQARLATYAVAAPASEIASRLQAQFGAHVSLSGYTLAAATLAPGDILQITLFWQTDAALTERYKVFVHVYAALDQPPVAQQDSEPGGGLVLTSLWRPGRTYADNHGVLIPPDLPRGEYRLMAGLYNFADGARLPVRLKGVGGGDRLDLGTIVVK